MTSTVTSADGTSIAFDSTGSGPALILVNGAMSFRAWSPTLQSLQAGLADGNTVFNYDRRGRGENALIETPEPDAATAKQAELDDLAALIAQAGGSAILMGFSSGSVLSLEAALAGLPVAGLILFEPPFVITADRPYVGADYRERVLAALTEGRRDDALTAFLVEASNVPPEFVGGMQESSAWAGMQQVAPTLTYDAAIMGPTQTGDPSLLKKFAAVDVPTLTIASQGSDPWLQAGAAATAELVPNATHQVLPGEVHDLDIEPALPVLKAWLGQLTAGR
ncbi:alpha/beta fold hydrolase [Tenggerimyces flavus]|uniref:Alpha/beta fold hydrolase n=1 Tax=Tenggerimyces flavus TaxID=1708749 RepID=A0ABV7YFU9_9ACTN|nr:alpha/beta hydrolase [Tenggerimyces flavus]MBM7788190.1 pimeloyl-ACP methyl ester carboxylesterase [Tenggerimyces flavus]